MQQFLLLVNRHILTRGDNIIFPVNEGISYHCKIIYCDYVNKVD